MKGFLSILLLSFFAPLHCFDKSKCFIVMRRDTNETICIESSYAYYHPVPTFNLDTLQIPADVGFKYWDWLGDWQLQNYTDVRRGGDENKVLIAGNHPFHFVGRGYKGEFVFILASNVSLWMAEEYRPRGAGILFEVDHLNETTKLKDSILKYCDKNPEVEGAKCTIVDYKNGTNLLNDGNHWTRFVLKRKENRTGVDIFEWSYGKGKPVVQCTWNNTKISNPFHPDHQFIVSAKSHQRNAAFYSPTTFYRVLSNNKEMKRNYTKRSSGEFCVEVKWNKMRSNDSNELMQVKNLASGRVQPPTNTTHDNRWKSFQWNHLDAGEYEITLRFDKRQPWKIDLCQAKWTLGDWAHVCDRLGIGSNDTEVQIKFCNLKGCNFSVCPHLQHEASYLFDCYE